MSFSVFLKGKPQTIQPRFTRKLACSPWTSG